MNILAIGDVVGSIGCKFLRAHLPNLKKIKNIDLVIANGENSADGNGITPASADYLFSSGVDVITTGNHAFRRREAYDLFDEEDCLLRPANFPSGVPGHGLCVVDKGRLRIAVINLMGVVYLDNLDCPFATMDRLLKTPDLPKIVLVDFHAEATGEKGALGYYLDGRCAAVWGTHTHVQTADERVNPKGTGYITDLGMTGPIVSVLGVRVDQSIAMFRGDLTEYFKTAPGDCALSGAVFDIGRDGKCASVTRVWERWACP